jgi:hypothetical protein
MPLPRSRENEYCTRDVSRPTIVCVRKPWTMSSTFKYSMALVDWVTMR